MCCYFKLRAAISVRSAFFNPRLHPSLPQPARMLSNADRQHDLFPPPKYAIRLVRLDNMTTPAAKLCMLYSTDRQHDCFYYLICASCPNSMDKPTESCAKVCMSHNVRRQYDHFRRMHMLSSQFRQHGCLRRQNVHVAADKTTTCT